MSTSIDRVDPRGRHTDGRGRRARYPDATGFAERDSVRIHWESFGEGEQTVLLLPTWSIAHSLIWKFQVPYLAHRFRVITYDPRGNGLSDRPREATRMTGASSQRMPSRSSTPSASRRRALCRGVAAARNCCSRRSTPSGWPRWS